MTVLVLADVGQRVYHVGDEAMGVAAVQAMRDRGARVLVCTRDPEHSERYIGADGYVRTLDVPWPPAERERFLATVRDALAGRADPTDPVAAEVLRFSREVGRADAVLIAGGGNMNSAYGWLLHERAALGLVAAGHGLPLVVSGQTFGPALTGADASVLAELLDSARLVLARESGSFDLARSLGQDAVLGLDDAHSLVPGRRRLSGEPLSPDLPDRYLCATLAPVPEEAAEAVLASWLDRASRLFGVPVVFLPHMGDPADDGGGDVGTHRGVAARMSTGPVVLPMVHADTAVRVHAGAEANLSSRYHPIVFSLAHGVPALGLSPNGYSSVRIAGALRHLGLADYAVPMSLLDDSGDSPADEALEALHEEAESLRSLLRSRRDELIGWQEQWWDAVVEALSGRVPVPEGLRDPEPWTAAAPVGSWRIRMRRLVPVLERESVRCARAEAEADRAKSVEAGLRVARDEAEERVRELEEAGVGALGPRGRRLVRRVLGGTRGLRRAVAAARSRR